MLENKFHFLQKVTKSPIRFILKVLIKIHLRDSNWLLSKSYHRTTCLAIYLNVTNQVLKSSFKDTKQSTDQYFQPSLDCYLKLTAYIRPLSKSVCSEHTVEVQRCCAKCDRSQPLELHELRFFKNKSPQPNLKKNCKQKKQRYRNDNRAKTTESSAIKTCRLKLKFFD